MTLQQHESSKNALLAEKRACVAEMMDAHPQVFPSPSTASSWSEFVNAEMVPQGRDRRTLDQALSRLVDVIRTAQAQQPPGPELEDVMQRVEASGEPLELDPQLLALASDSQSEANTRALSQFFAIYKTMVEMGAASGAELHQAIDESFARLPAVTPLMRDLIAAARRLSMLDLEFALGPMH